MVRSFSPEALEEGLVDDIVAAALRAPTAGNSGGTAWVVLEGAAETSVYFDATMDVEWLGPTRTGPKASAGRPSSSSLTRRPRPTLPATPNWTRPMRASGRTGRLADAVLDGDAAFGVMTVLLRAVDAGLGACIVGTFRGEAELAAQLGVPEGWRLFCAVALGRPDGHDHRSASLDRPRPGSLTASTGVVGEDRPT